MPTRDDPTDEQSEESRKMSSFAYRRGTGKKMPVHSEKRKKTRNNT